MMFKEVNMIFPHYLKDFACTGSACADNCCKGWKIEIDKATYLSYKNYSGPDPGLKNKFATGLKRNRKNPTDKNYANIILNADRACPFQDENKLCEIQRNMGMEALSATCMCYPRSYNSVNNVIELSATMSCPEVARLALVNRQGIDFISEPFSLYPKAPLNKIVFDLKKPHALVVKYFFDIQTVALMILQYRCLSLEKRLMILAILSHKLAALFSGKENGRIEQVLDDFANADILQAYAAELDNLNEPDYPQQLALLQTMSMQTVARTTMLQKYAYFMSRAVNAIFVEEEITANVVENYRQNGVQKYKQLAEERAYMLENYLVSSLYEQLYPINRSGGTSGNVFDSYMQFAAKFIMLRTLISGLLVELAITTEEEMVSIVQMFTHTLHHNSTIMSNLLAQIKEDGAYSLSGIMLLLNI